MTCTIRKEASPAVRSDQKRRSRAAVTRATPAATTARTTAIIRGSESRSLNAPTSVSGTPGRSDGTRNARPSAVTPSATRSFDRKSRRRVLRFAHAQTGILPLPRRSGKADSRPTAGMTFHGPGAARSDRKARWQDRPVATCHHRGSAGAEPGIRVEVG